VPNRRASHGVAARPAARPRRYPLTVHAAVASEVCRSVTMSGTAMLTTEESIMDSIGPPRKASRVRADRRAAPVPSLP
jgi:hypothetical protein